MWKLFQKHATIVEGSAIEDLAGAEDWVRRRVGEQHIEIEPAAARLLGQLAGFPQRADPRNPHGDIGRLRGEVDRLLLYTLGQPKISVDDARQVAGAAALQDDWAMINAIEAGQAGNALRQLALILDSGAPSEKVLGQLGWLVRTKFPTLAPDGVRPAVDALFRTDLDLKQSAGDPRVLLERLVVELCSGRRASVRRW
jgi:DNA polymerase III delta subunit